MSTSYIGAQIAVAAGTPATFDKTGYEALTWVSVAHPVSAPSPGTDTNIIDVPNLTTGFTKGAKGASMGRNTTLAFANVDTDAGQLALKGYAVETYTSEISVRITFPAADNRVFYMSGLAHSLSENEMTTEQYQGFSVGFRQNYAHVDTTPA